ncbi:MAG: pyridoxamine 5'-phosphate oxidase family protein [Pseudomonadota bacterium]
MIEAALREDFIIKDEEALRSHFPARHPLAVQKSRPTLDKHSIAFIERSPFLCLGTQTKEGQGDVSPRGDPPGFVKILDEKTLLIPDRPGNNRLDTLSNILNNPSVGLLFLIPGLDDTMRVNGKAQITTDPELLAPLAIKGRTPTVAILVTVEEVFIHCAKAFRRSKLWDPASHQERGTLPSIAQIILDQTAQMPEDPKEMAKIDADLEEEYKKTLY